MPSAAQARHALRERRITYEKVRDKLGLVGVDRMNDLFERCVRGVYDEVNRLMKTLCD